MNSLEVRVQVYPTSGIAYQEIPKNACSAIKSALLKAEGYNVAEMTHAQMHQVAWSYRAKSIESIKESRSLIAWRDPVERFVSGYLDKVVLREPEGRQVINGIWQRQRGVHEAPIDASVSLSEFADFVDGMTNMELDAHFRPQASMFVLAPDIVIDLQDPNSLSRVLGTVGLAADPGHNHRRSGRRRLLMEPERAQYVDGEAWRCLIERLDCYVATPSLVTPELHERLSRRFSDDYAMKRVLGLS